jgi:uncharacterized protein YraI
MSSPNGYKALNVYTTDSKRIGLPSQRLNGGRNDWTVNGVNVHKGYNTWTGSTGCMTLHTTQYDDFIKQFTNGAWGYFYLIGNYNSKNNLDGTPPPTVSTFASSTASSTLNIREGAGTSFAIKDTLKNGEYCQIIGAEQNGFVKITYNDLSSGKSSLQTGYVSKTYLAISTANCYWAKSRYGQQVLHQPNGSSIGSISAAEIVLVYDYASGSNLIQYQTSTSIKSGWVGGGLDRL